MGLPSGGTLDGTDGTALGNLEDRPTGQHTHTINDPGHSHTESYGNDVAGNPGVQGKNNVTGIAGWSPLTPTSTNTTGITVNATGAVAGTNAPYIQLMAIKPNDITPPVVSITGFPPPGSTCLSNPNNGTTAINLAANYLQAYAYDPGTPASGVASVKFFVQDITAGFPAGTVAGSFSSGNIVTGSYWTGPLINLKDSSGNPASLSDQHQYTVTAQATDGAGNLSAISSPASAPFVYDINTPACVGPYIKTGSGDVHSQGSINTPGGP